MHGLGAVLEERDLAKKPLSEKELLELIGDRDPVSFLNPKSPVYKEKKMGSKAPSHKEAVQLMAHDPNLIRRPISIKGNKIVIGFDEKGLRDLVG